MHRSRLYTLTALALLVVLAACGGGGGDSRADVEARLVSQLLEDGLTEQQASCFAELLVTEIGLDEIKDVDFSAEEPPEALREELTAAAIKAAGTCKISPADLTGQSGVEEG